MQLVAFFLVGVGTLLLIAAVVAYVVSFVLKRRRDEVGPGESGETPPETEFGLFSGKLKLLSVAGSVSSILGLVGLAINEIGPVRDSESSGLQFEINGILITPMGCEILRAPAGGFTVTCELTVKSSESCQFSVRRETRMFIGGEGAGSSGGAGYHPSRVKIAGNTHVFSEEVTVVRSDLEKSIEKSVFLVFEVPVEAPPSVQQLVLRGHKDELTEVDGKLVVWIDSASLRASE